MNLIRMTAEQLLLLAVMQPALQDAIDKELDRRAIQGTAAA